MTVNKANIETESPKISQSDINAGLVSFFSTLGFVFTSVFEGKDDSKGEVFVKASSFIQEKLCRLTIKSFLKYE